MEAEEKYEMMKLRVLHSFKWEKDITEPLAEEFGKDSFHHYIFNYLHNIYLLIQTDLINYIYLINEN